MINSLSLGPSRLLSSPDEEGGEAIVPRCRLPYISVYDKESIRIIMKKARCSVYAQSFCPCTCPHTLFRQ